MERTREELLYQYQAEVAALERFGQKNVITFEEWLAIKGYCKNDSLQQEQPKVDLEKEIETYFKGWYMDETDQGYILRTPDDYAGLMSVKQIARHFYELGLNARKEE